MELVNMNKVTTGDVTLDSQIDNTKQPDQVSTSTAPSDASVNQAKPTEEASEPSKTDAPSVSTRRHIVMYLAGGIWKDNEGQYWCRDAKSGCIQSKTFTDGEFDVRADIRFMVEYGAMKDTISE